MSFTVHHHPGKRVRPQKLAKILETYWGITPKNFEAGISNGRVKRLSPVIAKGETVVIRGLKGFQPLFPVITNDYQCNLLGKERNFPVYRGQSSKSPKTKPYAASLFCA